MSKNHETAAEALHRVVNRCIADGAPVIVEQRAPQTFVIPDSALEDRYGDGSLRVNDWRLRVNEVRRGAGFGLGCVKRGAEGRQVTAGPLVPGPWAYAFELPSVIDTMGGTGAEIARERANGTLIEASIGDLIVLDSTVYEIVWSSQDRGRHEYVSLSIVDDLAARGDVR